MTVCLWVCSANMRLTASTRLLSPVGRWKRRRVKDFDLSCFCKQLIRACRKLGGAGTVALRPNGMFRPLSRGSGTLRPSCSTALSCSSSGHSHFKHSAFDMASPAVRSCDPSHLIVLEEESTD